MTEVSVAALMTASPEATAEFHAYWAECQADAPHAAPLVTSPAAAAAIRAALDAGRPFSMVRLGDGEGGCLFWGRRDDYPRLADFVTRLCMTRHFGPRAWTEDDFDWMRQDIARAARRADIASYARRQSIYERLLAEPVADIRGNTGATWADRWVGQRRRAFAGQLYRDGYLHRDLLPHYARIAAGREVVIVSSLGDAFARHACGVLGGRLAAAIAIPGQWSNGARDGSLFPQLAQVRDRLADHCAAGRLVLVGAGLAGKGLCRHAADRGAVALDVGSVMDVWAGRPVRVYHSAEFVERHRL
jgi:hypothetical protein